MFFLGPKRVGQPQVAFRTISGVTAGKFPGPAPAIRSPAPVPITLI